MGDYSGAMATDTLSRHAGTPEFKVIDIDVQVVAKQLDVYLKRGSKLTGVSLEDIELTVTNDFKIDNKTPTLVELLEGGMRLFDAMVWMTAGRPAEYPLVADPEKTKATIPSLSDIAKSVFYCYFFLVTQARYPASRNITDKPHTPAFLTNLLQLDKEQHHYTEMICSFRINEFDPGWARHVNYKGLGQETLSRFGLGVAGYRLFQPFRLYACKEDAPDHIKNAYEFAKNIASADPTWDVHPLTRDPAVLTKRGNLNKNLNNLMLECFTTQELEEMVTAKVLHKMPEVIPHVRNYVLWTPNDDISGTTVIFPKPK